MILAQAASINKTPIYFPALNGLRAVAALMIFLHHYFANHPKMPVFLNMLVTKMHVGLILFFILSGFLIPLRYFRNQAVTPAFIRKYYKNRLVRVYPLYIVMTVIILLWQSNTDWRTWALNITMAKALFDEYKFTGLAQAWSLTLMEMFYLFAPAVHVWVVNNRNIWWLLLPAYGCGILLVALSGILNMGSFFADVKFMLIFTVFGHAFSFLFGMWCMRNLDRIARLKSRFSFYTYSSIVALVLLFYAWSFIARRVPVFGAHEYGGIFISNVLAPLIFGFLILGLVLEETLVRKFLAWKPMLRLGKASYAFYLLNMGFFADLIYRYVAHNPIAVLLITGIASILVYEYFEKPIMKRFGGKALQVEKPVTR